MSVKSRLQAIWRVIRGKPLIYRIYMKVSGPIVVATDELHIVDSTIYFRSDGKPEVSLDEDKG